MLGSAILDVTIGLIFIFLIMGLMVSAAQEVISRWFSLRGKNLRDGLSHLFSDMVRIANADNFQDKYKPNNQQMSLVDDFYDHPLIRPLSRKNRPSYLEPRVFATALVDTLRNFHSPQETKVESTSANVFNQAKSIISKLPEGQIKQALTLVISQSGTGADAIEKGIEGWFNQTMERVSGWYRKRIQVIGLILAFVFAVAANVDTLALADALWKNPVLRESLVVAATQAVQDQAIKDCLSQAATDTAKETCSQVSLSKAQGYLDAVPNLPIGWAVEKASLPPQITVASVLSLVQTYPSVFFQKAVGWMLTALAASLGAPFWFDILGKLVQLRSSGGRVPLSSEKKAETKA